MLSCVLLVALGTLFTCAAGPEPGPPRRDRVDVVAADQFAIAIAMAGEDLFWATQQGVVWRKNLSTGSVKALAEVGRAHRLVPDKDIIWALVETDSREDSAVVAVPRSGGAPREVCRVGGRPFDIVPFLDGLLWTDRDSGTVFRVPKKGGPAEALVKDQDDPAEIVSDGRTVYWINHGHVDPTRHALIGAEIVRWDGSGPPKILSAVAHAFGLALSSGSLFWSVENRIAKWSLRDNSFVETRLDITGVIERFEVGPDGYMVSTTQLLEDGPVLMVPFEGRPADLLWREPAGGFAVGPLGVAWTSPRDGFILMLRSSDRAKSTKD